MPDSSGARPTPFEMGLSFFGNVKEALRRDIHKAWRRLLRSFSSESGQIPERVSKRVQITKSQLDVHHFPGPWSLKSNIRLSGSNKSNRFQTSLRTKPESVPLGHSQSHLLTVSILHEILIQNWFYFYVRFQRLISHSFSATGKSNYWLDSEFPDKQIPGGM